MKNFFYDQSSVVPAAGGVETREAAMRIHEDTSLQTNVKELSKSGSWKVESRWKGGMMELKLGRALTDLNYFKKSRVQRQQESFKACEGFQIKCIAEFRFKREQEQ